MHMIVFNCGGAFSFAVMYMYFQDNLERISKHIPFLPYRRNLTPSLTIRPSICRCPFHSPRFERFSSVNLSFQPPNVYVDQRIQKVSNLGCSDQKPGQWEIYVYPLFRVVQRTPVIRCDTSNSTNKTWKPVRNQCESPNSGRSNIPYLQRVAPGTGSYK